MLFYIALCTSCTYAEFSGFPLAGNTNAPSWYEARDLYNPIGQLYSGVVERCSVTTVSAPSIVQMWTVSAGSSNEVETVVTDGATNVCTNVVLLTMEVITTNQIAPFLYAYTDQSGAHSATGYPYLSAYFLNQLDASINSLIPKFIARSTYTNGSYNSYFASVGDLYTDDFWASASFLMESKAGLFDRTNIGVVTNTTTNVAGWVTGGTAYYTRQPPTTRNWLISEFHATTNGWEHLNIGDFDTKYFATNVYPVITYIQGGSNAFAATSLTITGDAINTSNQTTFATSEVVSLSSTSTLCSIQWYNITNITTTASINNTGDVFAVSYTNEIVLYGDRPYRLYPSDLDERWKVLTCLVDVKHTSSWWVKYWDLPEGTISKYSHSQNGMMNTIAELKSTVEANYEEDWIGYYPMAGTDVEYYRAADYYGGAIRQKSYLVVTNIATNATMASTLHLYAPVYSYGYDWIDTVSEFDAHGNSYVTNQSQIIYSKNLSIGEVAFDSAWIGAVLPFPNWPASNPVNIGDTTSRGYTIGIPVAAQEWNFEYK